MIFYVFLNFDGVGKSFFVFGDMLLGFVIYDVIILFFVGIFVFFEVIFFDGGDEFGEFVFVFGVDFGKGEDGSGLNSS